MAMADTASMLTHETFPCLQACQGAAGKPTCMQSPRTMPGHQPHGDLLQCELQHQL